MKFSVLLSVYRKEQPAYLRQSLDSIFTQTLLPDEVVLVKDGPLTDALDEVADMACRVNSETEDIGARRLYTMMERLLEDISFEAPDLEEKELRIDRQFVKDRLSQAAENMDISQYIL